MKCREAGRCAQFVTLQVACSGPPPQPLYGRLDGVITAPKRSRDVRATPSSECRCEVPLRRAEIAAPAVCSNVKFITEESELDRQRMEANLRVSRRINVCMAIADYSNNLRHFHDDFCAWQRRDLGIKPPNHGREVFSRDGVICVLVCCRPGLQRPSRAPDGSRE